jgi:hypothetical protein
MRLRLFVIGFSLTNLAFNGINHTLTAQSGTRPPVFSGEDIMRILPGHTLLAQDEHGPFWMYYPEPGTVWGHTGNGDVDVGRWWVEDGRYCRSWRRWYEGSSQCWLLASSGEDRIAWVLEDGTIQGESLIQSGNAIGARPAMLASLAPDVEIAAIEVTGTIGPDRTAMRDDSGSAKSSSSESSGGSSGSGSSGGGTSSGSGGTGSSSGSSSGDGQGSSSAGSSGGGSSGGNSSGKSHGEGGKGKSGDKGGRGKSK